MGKYGMYMLAGNTKMTPKQFGNSIAKMIGGYTSNVNLEIKMERDKAAIRSLFQIASIVFQRIVSRTPLDEEYKYETVDKDGNVKERYHEPDNSSVRYDWKMIVKGENEKIFTCSEFIAKNPDFGMEFNDKNDINLILTTLLNSDLKPRTIKNNKGELIPDFDIQFDNQNEHFKTIEYGRYRKGPTEPKPGKNYLHGVTEDHFTYQAPKGFYAITMKEYEAFISTHESDRWRTLSQKMLRQRVEKVFSDKKFNQILKICNEPDMSTAFQKGSEEEDKKRKKEYKEKLKEALRNSKPQQEDEDMIRQNVFEEMYKDSSGVGYWKREFGSIDKIKGLDREQFEQDIKDWKAGKR